jgi:D-sedoheptulose 7-phosphate isomerase
MIEKVFEDSFQEAAICLERFRGDRAVLDALTSVADRLTEAFSRGGKVLIAGNGGSMTDAMHFAEEWTGRFRKERRPFPALALSDPSHLTCVANDYGFEFVFSLMVQAFAGPADILILLTTSGNSANLLRAAESAKQVGCHVVGFLGKGGGKLRPLCDTVIMAPGETSDRIQELHMMSLHILIEAVEAALEKEQPVAT